MEKKFLPSPSPSVEREFIASNDERIRDLSRPLRFYFIRNPYAADDPILSNSVCVVYFDFDLKQLLYRNFNAFEAMKYGFTESMFLSVFLNPKQYSFLLSSFFSENIFKDSQIGCLNLENGSIDEDNNSSVEYLIHTTTIINFIDAFKQSCMKTSDIAAEIMRSYYYILNEVTEILRISKVF